MRLASLFAKRYLSSKKSHSVINIISRVSAFAVGVPVAAMVILLSVSNGFEDLVRSMYNDFDPDVAITATLGKGFDSEEFPAEELLTLQGVAAISQVVEDNALLEYRGRQVIATIRGVDDNYERVVPIADMLVSGKYELRHGDFMEGITGQGVAYALGFRSYLLDPIKVLAPRRGGAVSSLLPVDSYRSGDLYPTGVFALDAETDGTYVIAPIEFARELFDRPDQNTSVMVKLTLEANPDRVAAAISGMLGPDFKVLTRYQQKASMYRIMSYEKWGIFAIILMVLVIASFSIVGSLVMLIIDKRDDIRTLFNVGGSVDFVRSVFVRQGMIVSSVGAAAGMALGLLVCGLQIWFGIIKIPAQTFLIDSYPVIVRFWDMVAVAAAFVVVNYIITTFTVRKMISRSSLRI